MRSASADYLEAARLEELAEDLRSRGYRVKSDARIGDQVFDLFAQRGSERLVFEVKARSRLKDATEQVARLRAAAQEAGLTQFRLVVVNEPHEVEVTIGDFENELARYLLEEELPSGLDEISSATRVEGVTDVAIQSVDIRRSGIHVRGRASVDVELNYGGGTARDGLTVSDSLPFTFDVELGPDLKLVRVNEVEVDLSGFYR